MNKIQSIEKLLGRKKKLKRDVRRLTRRLDDMSKNKPINAKISQLDLDRVCRELSCAEYTLEKVETEIHLTAKYIQFEDKPTQGNRLGDIAVFS